MSEHSQILVIRCLQKTQFLKSRDLVILHSAFLMNPTIEFEFGDYNPLINKRSGELINPL